MNPRKNGYGTFGNLSKHYDEARQGFPQEIIDYFWSFLKTESPIILDAGCGTGISTRHLIRDSAKIFGSDNDSEMIKQAQMKGKDGIGYTVASANDMPFQNGQFDAVTAFSAFHWFCDRESIDEIKRVLKNGGGCSLR